MIQVENLTRYYGHTVGVRSLSFEVPRGEVLGFLGPNGAGKTTTMKMLTCYIPPTSGTARICGFDIVDEPMEVRRRIGYLPEKNPLYKDMCVREYLRYVCELKGVSRNRIKSETDRTIEQCGLEPVPNRLIGSISKGFQQRVGMAQAIINDPELLILDEPTLGLDPKQIIGVRQLIKTLGQTRTIILSSHILPEVSQVCNRIIILNDGELIAIDTPENLRSRIGKSSVLRLTLRNVPGSSKAGEILAGLDGVISIRNGPVDSDKVHLSVESKPGSDPREMIIARLVEERVPILEIRSEELSLEDIFLHLVTGEES